MAALPHHLNGAAQALPRPKSTGTAFQLSRNTASRMLPISDRQPIGSTAFFRVPVYLWTHVIDIQTQCYWPAGIDRSFFLPFRLFFSRASLCCCNSPGTTRLKSRRFTSQAIQDGLPTQASSRWHLLSAMNRENNDNALQQSQQPGYYICGESLRHFGAVMTSHPTRNDDCNR